MQENSCERLEFGPPSRARSMEMSQKLGMRKSGTPRRLSWIVAGLKRGEWGNKVKNGAYNHKYKRGGRKREEGSAPSELSLEGSC